MLAYQLICFWLQGMDPIRYLDTGTDMGITSASISASSGAVHPIREKNYFEPRDTLLNIAFMVIFPEGNKRAG